MSGANKLDIPQALKERNDKIGQYCQLQIAKYELLYKAVEQNTLKYDASIDSCNNSIKEILNDLKDKKDN